MIEITKQDRIDDAAREDDDMEVVFEFDDDVEVDTEEKLLVDTNGNIKKVR